MAAESTADLLALVEGAARLVRKPWPALAMLAVGTLLGAVGPLLQRWSGRSDDPAFLLLGAVGMLPWELYFLPRFLARMDAEERDLAGNPRSEWRDRFEARWLRTLLAKLALNLAMGLGLMLFLVPGLLVLFAFGWAPYRVLLRGETLGQAMRGSLAMMRRHWRRAVLMVGAALLVAFAALAGLLAVAAAVHPGGDPQPFRSPIRWILEAASVAINLWLGSTLLSTYQRLEGYPEPSSAK